MLGEVIREAAERWGDRSCLVSPTGWSLTYRALDRLADEVAAGLARAGIGEGDVVALVLPSLPEHVVLYGAAARLGAITAGVNARLAAPERAAVLDRLAPDLVVATPELSPGRGPVVELRAATPGGAVLDGLRRRGGSPPPLTPDLDRPVAIVCTSGTTGLPKGAVFAGRQLDFICEVDTGRRWGGGGAALGGTSLAHLGPTTKLAGNLHRGGTTFLLDRWRAAEALRLTVEHRMPAVAGIPTQIELMLREPSIEEADLSPVQAVIIGGGPATPSLVRTARRRFGAPVATRYACTEAGIGLGTDLAADPTDAEVSVGRPHRGVELALRDPAGGRDVAPGQVGEVCLRSPARMVGYWRDPDATAEALTADGFVRTGDLGRLDDEGRLVLAGRAREMYVRGGYNVYPMEVEAVLADLPPVAQVAVASRPDPVMGEIGVAVVVPADPRHPPSLDDLRAGAAGRLARHKLPEGLVVVDDLPLTAMDKVDRSALAALISGR